MPRTNRRKRAAKTKVEVRRRPSAPSAPAEVNKGNAGDQGTFWDPFHFADCADLAGARFRAGEPALDGLSLVLSVKFSTHGVRDDRKWEIWPHEARVQLSLNSGGSALSLGTFRAPLSQSISPAFDTHKSDTKEVSFVRRFSSVEMAAIEKWRDGRDFKVQVNVGGFGKRQGFVTWNYFRDFTDSIPRSEWSDMLTSAHILDNVHLAVSARPGDERMKEAVKYLRTALEHHSRGEHSIVAQTCRKAVEEIGTASFGRKCPREVKAFLDNPEERKEYTLEDRAAIVLLAAKLLLHSGAHAGPEERDWRRADAELALAVTAALLQIAPSRLANAEPAPKASSNEGKATS